VSLFERGVPSLFERDLVRPSSKQAGPGKVSRTYVDGAPLPLKVKGLFHG